MSATLKDLFIYIYDLSPLDMDLLLTLIAHNNKQMTLEDLSKAVNRDKSTVFRSLPKINRIGNMCKRKSNFERGRTFPCVFCYIERNL